MKNINFRHLALQTLLLFSMGVFFSCSDLDKDNDSSRLNYPTAVVTVKSIDGNVILQVDDKTAVYPVNLQKVSYDKEFRAFVNYRNANDREAGDAVPSGGSMDKVYVNWLQDILTKPMADRTPDDEAAYGNDPVEIVNDWTTVCEDGYLTLRIRTYFGGEKKHVLNLVRGDDPYEVILYHDACEDVGRELGDAAVAFRLDKLPDTGGSVADLKLSYLSFSGKKTLAFKYCTRKN